MPAAFLTGVLAAAAEQFRRRGNGLVLFAEQSPEAPAALQSAVEGARQNTIDAGCWLIATADAIDNALTMTPDDPVAVLNASGLDAAVAAFEKYVEVRERGAGLYQAVLETALCRARSKGTA